MREIRGEVTLVSQAGLITGCPLVTGDGLMLTAEHLSALSSQDLSVS